MGPKSFRTWEWAPPSFRKDESCSRERRKVENGDRLIFCRKSVVNPARDQRHFYDDEEEKPDRDGKEDHLQREKGDAKTAIGGVGPQRQERPSCTGPRRRACAYWERVKAGQ